jgi:hypothetical protein
VLLKTTQKLLTAYPIGNTYLILTNYFLKLMKLKQLIAVFILLLLFSHAQSQTSKPAPTFHWEQLGVAPEFKSSKCLQLHNGNTIVALLNDGTSKRKLCYSLDFGKSWVQNELPYVDWAWCMMFSLGNQLRLIPSLNNQKIYISTNLGATWTEYSDAIEGESGYISYLDHNTRYKHFGYDYTIFEYEGGLWRADYSGKAESQWSAPKIYVGLRDNCFGSIENSPFVNIRYYFQGVTAFFTGKPGLPIYCSKSVMVPSQKGYYNIRNNLLISTDQGKNWEAAHESPADPYPGSLALEQLFRVCANGKLFGDFTKGVTDTKGNLFEIPDFCFSNDNGKKWISLTAPGREHTKEVLFLPDGSLLAITASHNIYKSSLAVGCAYDASGENCKYPVFDEGKPIVTGSAGGSIVIEGSDEFTKLVARALVNLKTNSPDLYEKYIYSPTYNGLKGIKIDCERGVNHPDASLFIQLTMKTMDVYNKYNNCIELLASTILHEAIHVYQANMYMKTYGGTFWDFCKASQKDLAVAQKREREPLAIQTQYLKKAFPNCSCPESLRKHWCWIINLYESEYPDSEPDGFFTAKDNENWAAGNHPEIKETCKDDNAPQKTFIYDSGSASAPSTQSNTGPATQSTPKAVQKTEDNAPKSKLPALSNGSFTNSQDWGIVNGTVAYDDGIAAIKPQKSNQPAVLKHQPFQIPPNAHTLKFKMDKRKVGDANLKIILRDQQNGNAEVVYLDEIRQGVDKFNKGLDVVNKALNNGEIITTPEKTKMEPVSVDISNFSGKLVALEISFETLGMFKPKILLDDFEIK